MKSFKEIREGAENYTVKKGPYTRKVDGKTADKMKKQGWELVAREEVEEARQMKDPKKDSMVHKDGKTIVIDKSKEKEYLKKGWSLAESTELSEATVSRSDFEKLKKGMRIEIDFGSSISSSQKRVFTVKSTSRSAKYNVDKINMTIDGRGKYHLYSRGGKDATLALGNMAAMIKSYKILGTNESVELDEAADFMKISKELLKHKSKGIEFEKAAAYIRVIHNNSAVSVQDKAFMALTKMLKDMDDLVKKTTITKILKDNGFRVRGGALMRESLDESGMTSAQKKKFDVLYKKMDGGKEHRAIRQKIHNPIKADDAFHALVKKMAMEGIDESVKLDEALQPVTKIKFDYKNTMLNDPKASDVGGIKQDWNNEKMAVRSAVKSLGGLITDSESPSRSNKFVGILCIGTRGDASKLSNSAIQKAVKSKGAEIQNHQFMKESVDYLEEAMLNEFSDAQLNQLKKAYSDLEKINVTSPTYKKLKKMLADMDVKPLEKVARKKIKFVSQIAARELLAKGGPKLKAGEYMEF